MENSKGKEKDKGSTDSGANLLGLRSPSLRAQETNPEWDIELDLNSSPEPPETVPRPGDPSNPRKRPPSPVWDIELDLNESDEDEGGRKRHKPDSG